MSLHLSSTSSTEMGFSNPTLPLVCIQGIGFVGSAMAIAVATARNHEGSPCFNVVAVDLDSPAGRKRAAELSSGALSSNSTDKKMRHAHQAALESGNLKSSVNPQVYRHASVVIVNVNLDVDFSKSPPTCNFDSLGRAIKVLGDEVASGALIIVETTVPPGTTEKIIAPVLQERLKVRGIPPSAVLLAHSYERVMPGIAYLDSIINFWRVYAGHTEEAADACEIFLRKIIDTDCFPLTRVATTKASEMGKIMENSYRATTIAFVEEWSRLAEQIGVDVFPVIDAIRMRPTHSNFRQPGFGVGGYCLTKDPLFGGIAARELFNLPKASFPISEMAVSINQRMPLETLNLVRNALGGSLKGKNILLLGVSYRSDVGDTRYAPAEIFLRQAQSEYAAVTCYDPLVVRWAEFDMDMPRTLPLPGTFDAIVFTSNHSEFAGLDLGTWLAGARPLLVDANRVFSARQLQEVSRLGLPFRSIGRGHNL